MAFDVELVKQAGITPTMTAKLVGVSRVTASHWHNGRSQPHPLIAKRVEDFLRVVRLAVEQEWLPLKLYPGRHHVLNEITEALVKAKSKLHA